jgi:tetratricopeptide (TPR) repeat protein
MLHPSTAELLRFASGMASRRESRSIVAHLLSGCLSCSVTIESFMRPKGEGSDLYHVTFQRLEKQTIVSAAAGARYQDTEPRVLLRQLEAHPVAHQHMLALNSEKFLSAGLVIVLLDDCRAHRYSDLAAMLRKARLATAIADRLHDSSPAREKQLWDLRASCHAQLAQAWRVSDELVFAEEAIATARACLLRGTGEPLPSGLVNESLGSLRMTQLRYQEAARSFSSAAEVFRHTQRADFVGRALVGEAIARGEGGAPQQALECLSEAMPKLAGDATMTLAACHAFVRMLIDSGKIDEAACRWIELRSLYTHFSDPVIQLKAAWLEGLLLKGQGHHSAALKLLRATRRGFRDRGAANEVAHVSLDMSGCYSRLGLADESQQALGVMMGLAQRHGLEREALLKTISLKAPDFGPTEEIARLAF